MKNLSICLWFDGNAEEAMHFYTTLIKDSEILSVVRMGDQTAPVLTANFRIQNMEITALNGGPHYKPTPALSMVIHCKNQEEIDYYWNGFLAEGKADRCGWLTDKFGFSWQIIPHNIGQLLQPGDPEKAQRAMAAMLKMDKLIIKDLENA